MEIVKKVVLTGYFGVGKSSLVKQFVYQKFSDQYLTTIGVKIDKKEITFGEVKIKLMLWDIAGESTALKIPKNYLAGAHGVLYVLDLTRKETYENIQNDLFEITKGMNGIPVKVLANKSDLVDVEFVGELEEEVSIPLKATSAKTGENVEEAFMELAKEMM